MKAEPGQSGAQVWAICGGSGSGKSTLVSLLLQRVPPGTIAVLHFDSYYEDLSHLSPEARAATNFDHPDSLEGDLLASHLDALMRGEPAQVPRYDFANHCRRRETDPVAPAPIVLVEGILLFAFPSVVQRIDYSVFIDVPEEVRLARRIERDVKTRGRSEESVRRQFAATVAPMHWAFVQPCAARADRVVRFGDDYAEVAEELAQRARRVVGASAASGQTHPIS